MLSSASPLCDRLLAELEEKRKLTLDWTDHCHRIQSLAEKQRASWDTGRQLLETECLNLKNSKTASAIRSSYLVAVVDQMEDLVLQG